MNYRKQALKLVLGSLRGKDILRAELAPRLWALVVFAEAYLEDGADGTRKDFGPKAGLKLVKKRVA